MSGPDLTLPAPDSNSIGSFQIGGSPAGTIRAFSPWIAVESQYANSPRLDQLFLDFADDVDQTANLDSLFDLIRSLDTAQGYGLDVWGRILAVNRVLKVALGPRYFGFSEGLPDYDPWNVSPFYMGEPLTDNYILGDPGFRVLLIAKAYSNICDGSIKSINTLMRMLFGTGGKCYVVDNGGMNLTYTFEFPLTPVQTAILQQSGVMPRPTGVAPNYSFV